MKCNIVCILLFILPFSLTAQDKPAVRKLPVIITVEEVSFSSLKREKRVVLKEEYIFEYDEKDQLVLSNYEYDDWGDNLILTFYQYDEKGRLIREEQGKENSKGKWSLTETDFSYHSYKGIDLAFARTEYLASNVIRELSYPLNLKTGLFINDKALRDSIFEGEHSHNEYMYDNNKNLLVHTHIEPPLQKVKTTSYKYSTVYSPYVCVKNLPVWYSSDLSSSSLKIPGLLITGLYTPVEMNITTSSSYDSYPSKITYRYRITKDEDNYPVTIEEYKGNSSEKYSPFLLYTFTYEMSENK